MLNATTTTTHYCHAVCLEGIPTSHVSLGGRLLSVEHGHLYSTTYWLVNDSINILSFYYSEEEYNSS